MALACMAGMLAGLVIDNRNGRVATFAALCIVGDRSLLYSIYLHWRELPSMHAGMLLGGMLSFLPRTAAWQGGLGRQAGPWRH
jgi:hypothetical protein